MSDFGMSKVIDTTKSRSTTPLTMVPGTVAYMPQEALGENPKYTEKLDCFSFGVLAIQIITRLFPNPSCRKREVESALSLTGTVLVPVPETECRKEHIDMIHKPHPLLDIAIDCLALRMENRPSAGELCQRLEELQATEPHSHHPPTSAESCGCQEIREHLEQEISDLRLQLEERSSSTEQCPTCAELRELNEALEESVQQTKRNSEEEAANLRREFEENYILTSEVEQCPVYV